MEVKSQEEKQQLLQLLRLKEDAPPEAVKTEEEPIESQEESSEQV
jgi:hypothetical protein